MNVISLIFWLGAFLFFVSATPEKEGIVVVKESSSNERGALSLDIGAENYDGRYCYWNTSEQSGVLRNVYTSVFNYAFVLIMDGDNKIWESNSRERAFIVVFKTKGNKMALNFYVFLGEIHVETKYFVNVSDKWEETNKTLYDSLIFDLPSEGKSKRKEIIKNNQFEADNHREENSKTKRKGKTTGTNPVEVDDLGENSKTKRTGKIIESASTNIVDPGKGTSNRTRKRKTTGSNLVEVDDLGENSKTKRTGKIIESASTNIVDPGEGTSNRTRKGKTTGTNPVRICDINGGNPEKSGISVIKNPFGDERGLLLLDIDAENYDERYCNKHVSEFNRSKITTYSAVFGYAFISIIDKGNIIWESTNREEVYSVVLENRDAKEALDFYVFLGKSYLEAKYFIKEFDKWKETYKADYGFSFAKLPSEWT